LNVRAISRTGSPLVYLARQFLKKHRYHGFRALYLKESAKGVLDEKHGFVWCFGASLSPLLPVIEINKEFTEFFNDPKREPTIHDDSGGYGVGWDAEIQIETLALL
jgi:hypothetical protein